MKILHLPDTFLPYATGGKETFVLYLIEALRNMGHENIVVIHRNSKINSEINEYLYNHIRVVVLEPIFVSYTQYWKKESSVSNQFAELLKYEKPDIIHFHDQSGGASISHLRIARQLGFKTVLTYHSPGQSCPQHALLRNGKILCDGYLKAYRCAKCLLSDRGIPFPLNSLLALPIYSTSSGENFKLIRLLTYHSNIKNYIKTFQEIYNMHDAIHVYAKWVKHLLMLNGIDEKKIYFSAQGLPNYQQESSIFENQTIKQNSLKILFIGRCTYIKGVHVLIEAIKKLPLNIPIEVHFLGPYWHESIYGQKLLRKIHGDKRFLPPKLIPPHEVNKYMQKIDACIIPSLWPETGPLVMLEALQNGVPVIASNFSGMAENIQHGVNGLLFERGNSVELSKCIKMLYERKKEGKNFDIKPVRDVKELAADMLSLYQKILGL